MIMLFVIAFACQLAGGLIVILDIRDDGKRLSRMLHAQREANRAAGFNVDGPL